MKVCECMCFVVVESLLLQLLLAATTSYYYVCLSYQFNSLKDTLVVFSSLPFLLSPGENGGRVEGKGKGEGRGN